MNDRKKILEDLLRCMILGLSRNGDNPEIEHDTTTDSLYVRLEHGDDKGRCIGRKGRVFWAMAYIISMVSHRLGLRTRLEALKEARHPNRDKPPVPFRPMENWDRPKLRQFISELTSKVAVPNGNLEEQGDGEATVNLVLTEGPHDDNLAEALKLLIRGVGSACGASVNVNIRWK